MSASAGISASSAGAAAMLAPEELLYSRSLLKPKPGDHVDEVHFASPVVVSRVVLVDTAKQQGAQPGLLRVFARDLQYPSASRFAPLCPSNLSAAAGQSSSFPVAEAVVTDHVILRGRYTALEVQLYGRAEHDPGAALKGLLSAAAASGHPLQSGEAEELKEQLSWPRPYYAEAAAPKSAAPGPVVKRLRLVQAPVSLPLSVPQPLAVAGAGQGYGRQAGPNSGQRWPDGTLGPAPQLVAPGASLLPLESVPPPLLEALRGAADLYREVGRDRDRICGSEAQGRLAPVMWAAKAVHRALAGQTSELELALATAPPRDRGPLARGELASFAEMACDWCLLLASGRCSRLPEVNVAMAGLAAAVVLAACAPAAPVLLAMGGAAAVVRALSAANPPADLVRLAVTACDALTLCCPGPAAEALLGRYEPPPPPREEEQAAVAAPAKAELGAEPGATKVDVGAEGRDGAGPQQALKAEGSGGAAAAGGTYGDAEAAPGGDEEDDGLGLREDAEEADHDSAMAAAIGEAGAERADAGGEEGARVRRASSGALAQAEDGAAEDGMYDGFYDDFDDYYGGEDYEGDGGAEGQNADRGADSGAAGGEGGDVQTAIAVAGNGGGESGAGKAVNGRSGSRSPSRSRSRSPSGSRGRSGNSSSSTISSDADVDAEMRDDDGDGVLTSAAADAQAGVADPAAEAVPAVKTEPGGTEAAAHGGAKPLGAALVKSEGATRMEQTTGPTDKSRRSRERSPGSRRRSRSRSNSRSRSRSGSRSCRRRSRSRTRSKTSRGARDRSRSRSRTRTSRGSRKPAAGEDEGRRSDRAPVSAAGGAVVASRTDPFAQSAAKPLLAALLRRPRSPFVSTAAARVMRRLTAADLVARVLAAASSLTAAAPASSAATVGPGAAAAAAMEAMAPLRQLVAALPDLAEVAAAAGSGTCAGGKSGILGGELSTMMAAAASAGGGDGRPQIPEPPSMDAPTLQIMASRPMFVALAAALAAVHAHAAVLRRALEAAAATAAAGADLATQQAAAAAQQAGAYAQQHLTAANAALLAGLRLLLVPLLSCPAGLAWLTSAASRPGVIALVAALDPTAEDAALVAAGILAAAARRAVAPTAAAAAAAAGGGAGSGPAAELAAMLCDALAADAAVKALAGTTSSAPQAAHVESAIAIQPDQAAIYGPMGPIILTLLHMVHGSDVGRQAAVLALSSSRSAMSTLLRAVRMRARAAKALALAAAGGSGSGGGGSMLYDEEDELEVTFPPESLYASSLLLAVTRDTRLQPLAGWLPIAGAVADAARAEAELLSGAAHAELLTGLGCQPEVPRRTARELQGRAEAGAALMSGGAAALVRLLEEGLPRLEQQTRRGAPADVDPRAAASLVRGGAERAAGVAITALELIATLLRAPSAKYMAAELYGMGTLAVLDRALRTGVAAVRAAAADGVWASLGGDCLDAGERARGRRTAAALLGGAMSALAALLLALQPLAAAPPADSVAASASGAGLKLRNRSVLQALLAAHATAVLTYDSLAASLAGGAAAGSSGVPGAPTVGHELLPARLEVAAAVGAWVEAGWEPAPLSTAFGLAHSYLKEAESERAHMGLGYILSGGPGPGSTADGSIEGGGALAFREPAAAALSPEACYCLLQLLGDVFPREWPPTPAPGQPAAAFPPPSCMARRSALASALEQVSAQFLRLLSFGFNSEARLVRCAAVRTAARAAGLGGGMPGFLAAPLVEALAALVRGQAAGAAPGPGPLTDARRLLEVLAPLAYKPTIKAALLDARAVSVLSRLLHRLVSTAMGPAPPAGSAAALEPADVPVVVGQTLEALRLLADPDISLSPAAPREKRLQEDVPPLPEATAMVTALLACLPHLGANAPLAAQLLASPAFGLATYAAGRAALRAGAGKWHTAQVGIGAGGGSELGRALEALRWAAQRLRGSADSARASAAPGAAGQEAVAVAAACAEVASKLEEVAANTKEFDLEGDFPPPPPAPQRFVAAVAAATEAATAAASSTSAPAAAAHPEDAELEAGGHSGAWWPWPAVCDNATQSFWRYCRARPVRGNPSRKLTRWDCPAAASGTTASLLPPEPLSRRRRPRDVPAAVSAALPRPAGEAVSGSAGGVAPSGLTSSSLDDDIPTITAPRRRGDGRGRGSSRAPSKHVDDYQRSTQPLPAAPSASGPAAAPPGRGAMGPPPPRPPAAQALPPPPQHASMTAPPPPMTGFGMAGGFRPPTLQPLPSADADSLYDDLFASTPSTAPPGGAAGGGMARAPSAGGNLASARSGALNSVSGMGSGPLNSSGGTGGHPQQHHQPLPPQQQHHQRSQLPAYQPPTKPQSDLGDDLYGNLLPPPPPAQQQVQQQQLIQQQEAPAGAAGVMTPQQLVALLRDPAKLRQVLSTNPGLATMLAQAAASMGINLSAALGGGGAGGAR